MILFLECIFACLLFSAIMVSAVFFKPETFFQEYAPEVQKKYLELNPDFCIKKQNEKRIVLVCKKLVACILFIVILTALVSFAGAKDFLTAFLYSYTIWFCVNLFDVLALDLGIFAHWKKMRLKGTESMTKEYCSNKKKHLIDGLYGLLIGLPVCAICGLLVVLWNR